jgi:hypothetical protein
MSIATVVAIIFIFGSIACAKNSNKKRQEELKQKLDSMKERMSILRKKNEKIRFINQFIDEIPELSYYEAAQLKKKLGNIYLDWNDE